MESKVIEIVKECIRRGVIVEGVCFSEYGTLSFIISGFSKSGIAYLYAGPNDILCKTRYNRIDVINTFEDLAKVAFDWNKVYAGSGYGWDYNWYPVFDSYGWVGK